ncbi:MAG TPA: glycerophosphodiester phosphodiesterase family protein, partial [Cytophagaceae bacterium]
SLISKIISDNKAEQWIHFSDANPDLLNQIQLLNPDIQLFYTAKSFEDAFATSINNNYTGFLIKVDYISKEQVAQAHANNLKVILWGVITQKATIEAVRKHPDGIMTDNIPMLQDILNNI